jgi:hypothetical protein
MNPEKATALRFFHAFTGCDTVSAFNGRGKKTAWDVWTAFPEVTAAFSTLGFCPGDISDELFALLQRFVVLLYDRTSDLMLVNDCRKHLFSKKGRSLDKIPPTSAALLQHVKRAAYQSGHVWGQCMTASPVIPGATDWGWTTDGKVLCPVWTLLPEAADYCKELLHCVCKVTCSTRCRCVNAALPCTSLCACDGECQREETD